ncbi:MAG: M18 family aminopeptidase [Lachnospiraceae bacterium]|nr:M18 family aminopeptidase [Lachnospiraceae bacterium]
MIQNMLKFIEESPTAFHAVANIAESLKAHGYTQLKETECWSLEVGGKYYVIRNDSSIIAFCIPTETVKSFRVTAAHSDSPAFKLKEKPEIAMEDAYVKLNTEKYGGMILSTWLDRPLSVAGRVIIEENGQLTTKLVNIEKDLLIIPNVAIHMNRDMNKGVEYNPQTDMLPLYSNIAGKDSFADLVAQNAGVKKEEILGSDLFVYNRAEGRLIGADEEFICAPRLDDLQCVYTALQGFLNAHKAGIVREGIMPVYAVFDNEEVGSGTKQGADSTFLSDVLERVCELLKMNQEQYQQVLAGSFLLSADNAHALHPNHPEKADITNRPVLNGGIVIKYHGSQKYTTDAYSAAFVTRICRRENLSYQTYANRSDIAGGSTLGNISTSHVSVPSADIGIAQLAMHSAYETAGVQDTLDMIRFMSAYFRW